MERDEDQKSMIVLLVEDEKLMNWSLSKSLSRWGFEVFPVFTGQDALRELQKSRYNIVLLDYQLPDMNGLEVAQHVRRAQPDAFILLVTAFQLGELQMEDGLIDGYLNKPVDMQQLYRTVKHFAKRPGALGA